MSAGKRVGEEIERQAWAKYAECVHIPKEWRKEMRNCFESAFINGFEAGIKWRDEQSKKQTQEFIETMGKAHSQEIGKVFQEIKMDILA